MNKQILYQDWKKIKICITVSKETIKTEARIEGKCHKIKNVRFTYRKDFMHPHSCHLFLPGRISSPI